MIASQLSSLGFVPTKRIPAGGSLPAGRQYERKGLGEPMCVFVADDQSFAEVVVGSGSRPRVYGRGRFTCAEQLHKFLLLHRN
jgi:hypothetical protein